MTNEQKYAVAQQISSAIDGLSVGDSLKICIIALSGVISQAVDEDFSLDRVMEFVSKDLRVCAEKLLANRENNNG